MQDKRIALFDNVKLLLIVLVVIGHLIDAGAVDGHRSARAAFVFIYSFHMPLFIFMSGLFLNRKDMTGQSVRKHFVFYVALGFILSVLLCATDLMLGNSPSFHLLSTNGIAWFLMALSAYYVLAWILRDADYVTVSVLSVLVALLAGYDSSIGDWLCLSRIVVFFPFFWLGHSMDAGKVASFFAKRSVKILGAIIVVSFALFCFLDTSGVYAYRGLFTGRHCYEVLVIENCSWINRLIAYAISFLMCFGVLGISPQRSLGLLTSFGSRTLQVYMLHYLVVDALVASGVMGALLSGGATWYFLFPIGAGLALLLSVKPFGVPFKALAKRLLQ